MRIKTIYPLAAIVGCAIWFGSCHSTKHTATTTPVAETQQPEVHQTPKVEETAVEGLNLGNKAPEIRQPDPDGKEIALSSLKGKVVLIDFWASWCGPCRRENPTVVAAAIKYKDTAFKNGKGFIVYSVSLDKGRDSWVRAIREDSLFWPTHVSDLALWNNAAALKYNVSAIPTNVLINGDGIIIAKSLRGEDLINTLERYKK